MIAHMSYSERLLSDEVRENIAKNETLEKEIEAIEARIKPMVNDVINREKAIIKLDEETEYCRRSLYELRQEYQSKMPDDTTKDAAKRRRMTDPNEPEMDNA